MARSDEQSPARSAGTYGGRAQDARGDASRWLLVGGVTAALILFLALLRFAIDLLGVVFLLVLVGFSLRALSDWLADGDSISGWSITAVILSVFATFAIGLWLFDGRDLARSSVIERRLPVVLTRAIDWAEERGWGRRVLLPGGPIDRMARRETAGPAPAHAAAPTGSPEAGPAAAPPSSSVSANQPSGPARPAAARRRERIRLRPPEAEAAEGPAGGDTMGVDDAGTSSRLRSAASPLVQTQTRLTTTQPSARVGTSVRLTATVTAITQGEPPTGVVVFRNGDEVLGSARLELEHGEAAASLVVLRLAVGTHTITAEYVGQDPFDGSRSALLRQAVTRQ
jgi:hypothetical protein